MSSIQSADIFCKVVDNFGDAGVCWRLARALASEGLAVRLWMDDLPRLKQLRPAVDVRLQAQMLDGFQLRVWDVNDTGNDNNSAAENYQPADLVIEAFACRMSDAMIERLAQAVPQPVWINLEYLSAERWTLESHGMSSPHPRLPLTQYFYFPGFAVNSGGLLRESAQAAERDAYDDRHRIDFLNHLGVQPAPDELLVSLFCYPQAPLQALFDAMRFGPRVLCLVPEGVASEAVLGLTGGHNSAGTEVTLGQLRLRVIPFLEPDDYDRLLWSCDLNFVRGEDSLVRAHWALQAFVWQLYPQQDHAHQLKLEAFLEHFCRELSASDAQLIQTFWRAWNGVSGASLDWSALCAAHPKLAPSYRRWQAKVASAGELSRGLIGFANKIR